MLHMKLPSFQVLTVSILALGPSTGTVDAYSQALSLSMGLLLLIHECAVRKSQGLVFSLTEAHIIVTSKQFLSL